MEGTPQAFGDSNISTTPAHIADTSDVDLNTNNNISARSNLSEEATFNALEEHEAKLQDRIGQCRNIIESLKKELHDEKYKLDKETKNSNLPSTSESFLSDYKAFSPNNYHSSDSMPYDSYSLSASVDRKLGCDDMFVKYDKQLEKYKSTLYQAQQEKKNAIRKQMLAKAYKLKLLEIENQCNIELLRVKQSMQCLEPLHMIVHSWKDCKEEVEDFDFGKIGLLTRYPDSPASDRNSLRDDEKVDVKSIAERVDSFIKDDISFLDNSTNIF